MDTIKFIFIVLGYWLLADVILLALWCGLMEWGNRVAEKRNPLLKVNNNFASQEAIATEDAAIARAKALL